MVWFKMWHDFEEYILLQCDKNPTRIVEIAVGKFKDVYDFLNAQENVEIIKTDINPCDDSVIEDDVTNPNLKIYENTDIIYSIRPPGELQPYLYNLAKKVNAMLIIKPLSNEEFNIKSKDIKLKNYRKASFYICDKNG